MSDLVAYMLPNASALAFDEEAFRAECRSAADDHSLFDDPQPVSDETADRAIGLLRTDEARLVPFSVACGHDGSIGILWKTSTVRIYVNLLPDGENTLFSQELEDRVSCSSSIAQIVSELRRRFATSFLGLDVNYFIAGNVENSQFWPVKIPGAPLGEFNLTIPVPTTALDLIAA